MARGGGKKKKNKSGLPLEVEEQVIGMSPTDLAVEVTFERNAIDALKVQKKNDDQIADLKKKIKEMDEKINTDPDVLKAQDALAAAKSSAAEELEGYLDTKEDLSALNKGWNDDIKNRGKKLKFMEKTLKRHIESGALKRK